MLFVDASTLFRRGRNQNTLEPEHAEQILDWYAAFEDVDGLAPASSTLDEIDEQRLQPQHPALRRARRRRRRCRRSPRRSPSFKAALAEARAGRGPTCASCCRRRGLLGMSKRRITQQRARVATSGAPPTSCAA